MKQYYFFFCAILFFVCEKAIARTIFAGSYAPISGDFSEKKVSINYPRPGRASLCGIELKSDVLVLNAAVWRKLADRIDVQQIHDDAPPKPADPVITADYSPRIRYVFSSLDTEYSSFVLRSRNGETLKHIANDILGDNSHDAHIVAVGYSCDGASTKVLGD